MRGCDPLAERERRFPWRRSAAHSRRRPFRRRPARRHRPRSGLAGRACHPGRGRARRRRHIGRVRARTAAALVPTGSLSLTVGDAERWSPLRHVPPAGATMAPLVVAVAGAETQEFIDQSLELAQGWRQNGHDIDLHVVAAPTISTSSRRRSPGPEPPCMTRFCGRWACRHGGESAPPLLRLTKRCSRTSVPHWAPVAPPPARSRCARRAGAPRRARRRSTDASLHGRAGQRSRAQRRAAAGPSRRPAASPPG